MTHRDSRLDVLRGLALLTIFITHMPGNIFETYTLRLIGFSDAAEAFVLMSGVAAGLAYYKLVHANQWKAARLKLWKRARTLYLAHIGLTFGAILIALIAFSFGVEKPSAINNMTILWDTPETVIVGIFLLSHQIGFVNILSLYAVLMLVAPLLLWGAKYAPIKTLLVSTLIWYSCGQWDIKIQNWPGTGSWFLNPFTWQILFTIGLVAGYWAKQNKSIFKKSTPGLALAWFVLLLALAWRHAPGLGSTLNHYAAELINNGWPAQILAFSKSDLSFPRLAHALALAYVLSYTPFVVRLCNHPYATPLIQTCLNMASHIHSCSWASSGPLARQKIRHASTQMHEHPPRVCHP